MIYLDNMGHLFSDSNIQEIYDFAVIKMKLKPEWNHYSKCFPHFDLVTTKKKSEAIKLGAKYIQTGSLEWQMIIKKMKETFQDEFPKYSCKGLYGQKIFRVDFKKLDI